MRKTSGGSNKRIAWSVVLVAAVGLVVWAASDSFAQGRGPCAEDAAKYCKDVQPGGGRMAQCLKEHENELSAACKERLAQMTQKGKEINEACQDDAMKLCKDVPPGGGRIYRCLKEHESDLSPACKEKLPKGGRAK